ncbi:MAG: VCBS repeat-containing protein [Planctomycetia bacterium]|nr:VCBS repeat-containing protein [Planctomycetia bacterium]
MTRRAHRVALQAEQLEDRCNPAGSLIPAGEFNWTQYSPTGELGQLLWNGGSLIYRSRVGGEWQAQTIAGTGGFTAGEYNSTDEVQQASQIAQLVFTTDGTPHALFLERQWNGQAGRYQTLIQHHARTTAGWQRIETIIPPWLSQWGPNNLVAEAGPNNSIHLIFTETSVAGTGVGVFGSGQLYSANNTHGWQFAKIANTADLRQDVWFTGGRWAPRFLSLAVDARNHAHVTYTPQFYIAGAFSTVRSELHYATNRTGSWVSQTVMGPLDGTADAGLGASVAIRPDGQPAIASYYVDRYTTGSPQSSLLLYHTLVNGRWNRVTVTNRPDGYVAGDGPRFTGFAPQLFFDSAGRANIVFSDEAGEHLPVSFANQLAGQIRLATQSGSGWSIQTVFRQTNPLVNQLLYPVAAARNGQITFAGLQSRTTLDGNRNPIRSDYTIIDRNAPFGLSTLPTPTISPVPAAAPTPNPVSLNGTTEKPGGWAVATDAGVTGQVFVFRADGTLAMAVTPFGNGYTGGVRIARADLTGDGIADLVTATGPGSASRVRVWNGLSASLVADFSPFPGYGGGLWVSTGDMNADGRPDIAVGTDQGNAPHVKVFSGSGYGELASFYAYAPGFRGGVRVVLGDINRDGFDDIVTGPGAGAGPHVSTFDGRSFTFGLGPRKVANDFYMFTPQMTAGLNLAVGDVDRDGFADIIAAPASGPAHLRIVSGQALASGAGPADLVSMYAWSRNTTGLRVSSVDADGDGATDVLVAPGGPNAGRIGLFAAPVLFSHNPAALQWIAPLPGLTTGLLVG